MGYLDCLNPYIFPLNLYHVAAMATLFSGFILALLLAFAKIEGQTANLFLSLPKPATDRYDAKENSRRPKKAEAANPLYEGAELTLTTLAVKLNIYLHDLLRIINAGMKKNFSDFIDEFRIREAFRKMHDPAHDRLTLLGIAYEAGFTSQKTFNRVFKKTTGKTPVEYKNGLIRELPNDRLAISSNLPSVLLRSGSPPNWPPVNLNRNFIFKNYLKILCLKII